MLENLKTFFFGDDPVVIKAIDTSDEGIFSLRERNKIRFEEAKIAMGEKYIHHPANFIPKVVHSE